MILKTTTLSFEAERRLRVEGVCLDGRDRLKVVVVGGDPFDSAQGGSRLIKADQGQSRLIPSTSLRVDLGKGEGVFWGVVAEDLWVADWAGPGWLRSAAGYRSAPIKANQGRSRLFHGFGKSNCST
jgi:hypothetical protein